MTEVDTTTIFEDQLDLPTEELSLCERFSKVNGTMKKIALPVSVAVGAIQIIVSVRDDVKSSSTRNTVEVIFRIAGGVGGRFAGRRGGSALGALIQPQNGAAVGALVGSILGAVIGSKVASCTIKKIGDYLSYGIVSKECVTCKAHFKIFTYKGEKEQNTCEYCEGTEDDEEV